jgi:hypothetical protein
VLRLSVSAGDFFAVSATPHVRRLAAVLENLPATLVSLVDGGSARLARPLADRVSAPLALEGEAQSHLRRAHGR